MKNALPETARPERKREEPWVDENAEDTHPQHHLNLRPVKKMRVSPGRNCSSNPLFPRSAEAPGTRNASTPIKKQSRTHFCAVRGRGHETRLDPGAVRLDDPGRFSPCGRSLVVKHHSSKVVSTVRFRPPAPPPAFSLQSSPRALPASPEKLTVNKRVRAKDLGVN